MKTKNIVGIGIVLVLLVLTLYFTGVFNVLGSEDENYVAVSNVNIHFNVPANTLDSDDYDIDKRGFLYGQEHTFDYFGKDLKITAYNQLEFEGNTYRGDWYRVVYDGEVKNLYSNSFENPFGSRSRYYQNRIRFVDGNWIEEIRDREASTSIGATINTVTRTDIDWETTISFKNDQLVLSNERIYTCSDNEVGAVDNDYCIHSDIKVFTNPSVDIVDFNLDNFITSGQKDATVIINNNYNGFDGIVRLKVEVINRYGVSETFIEDYEFFINSGENRYDILIPSYLFIADNINLEIYIKNLQRNVRVGRVSSSGTLTLEGSSLNTELQPPECTYRQKLDNDDDSPQCYQDIFVKKYVTAFENEKLSDIIASLQADLQYKISLVEELEGSIQDQADLINSLSSTLEEKVQIVASLQLNIQEQSEMILLLTDKIEEQKVYIQELTQNIEEQAIIINNLTNNLAEKTYFVEQLQAENDRQAELIKEMKESFANQGVIISNLEQIINEDIEMIKLLTDKVDEQAIILSNMQKNIDEQAEIIAGLTDKIEDQKIIIKELNLKLEEERQLVNSLVEDLDEANKIIKELRQARQDQNTNLAILVVVVIVFVGITGYLIVKRNKRK